MRCIAISREGLVSREDGVQQLEAALWDQGSTRMLIPQSIAKAEGMDGEALD